MKTIYKTFEQSDSDGKWFKTYEASDDFPVEYPFTDVKPPDGLKFPRYIFGQGWVEDKDQLIISLNQQLLDGQAQINQLQSDLLDMMELVSTIGGEQSV